MEAYCLFPENLINMNLVKGDHLCIKWKDQDMNNEGYR